MVGRGTRPPAERNVPRNATGDMSSVPGQESLTHVVEEAVGQTVAAVTPVSGGDIAHAFRVELVGDSASLFAKTLPTPPPSLFSAEARGLQFLAAASGGVPVPEVVPVADTAIVLRWIDAGPPSPDRAEEFGRRLAMTHADHPDAFGTDGGVDGYIGTLPLPGGPWVFPRESWPQMWREGRVLPYLRAAADAGAIDADDQRDIDTLLDRLDEVAGPPEPPARIHGDLWSGNVHWSADGPAYVIDPAAHGGHRETDLAMLALFGLPYLERVIAAYDETSPLADGWRERIPLHQLHPVLVHAVLFGGSYGAHAGSLARRMLRLSD